MSLSVSPSALAISLSASALSSDLPGGALVSRPIVLVVDCGSEFRLAIFDEETDLLYPELLVRRGVVYPLVDEAVLADYGCDRDDLLDL
jgi:hypothetical protein